MAVFLYTTLQRGSDGLRRSNNALHTISYAMNLNVQPQNIEGDYSVFPVVARPVTNENYKTKLSEECG
ncbi:hypothetical protein [Duncaniella dubosii]|uniref:hypothetical protein n=1 Tax=Duncaniella dubosii TaxID=2518971 RepID=UPI003F671DD5